MDQKKPRPTHADRGLYPHRKAMPEASRGSRRLTSLAYLSSTTPRATPGQSWPPAFRAQWELV